MVSDAYPKIDKENPKYRKVYEEMEKIVREEEGNDRLDIEKFMVKIAHEIEVNSKFNNRGENLNIHVVSAVNEIPERLLREIWELVVEEEER